MQLMTEPKLDHGLHHHLETHQQQLYHPIQPQNLQQQPQHQHQDQLDSSGALTSTPSHQQAQHEHHLVTAGIASNINQSQLNQLISQQQQLTLNPTPTASSRQTYQQHHQPQAPSILQNVAPRVQTHQQLASISPPLNNNTTTAADLAAQQPSSATMNNIQPTSYTKNHLINNNGAMHLSQADELSIKKRREDLSRRPSYRKIFNDITGMSGPLDLPPPSIVVGQLPPPVAQSRQSPQLMTGQPQQSQSQQQQQHQQQQPPTSSPSPQALDLLNTVGVANQAHEQTAGTASQSPVSIKDLQRTTPTQLAQQQQPQQQQQLQHSHHHQHPQLHGNHLQQHPHPHPHQHHPHQQQQSHQQQRLQQHHHPLQQQQQQQTPQHQQQQSQIHHQIQTASSPPITGVVTEEASKKRELRLQKNREAAKECRRKKKEYIKCLENRVAVLENQNKALIDELKTLKDLYCKSANE